MKLVKTLALLVMTICLSCSEAYCSTTKPGNDADADLNLSGIPTSCQAIPRGWKAQAAGFYLSPSAMRETVQGWQTAKVQAEERAAAIAQLEQLTADLAAENERALAELKNEIDSERRSHRKTARSAKRNGIIWGIVIGGAAGAVIAHNN